PIGRRAAPIPSPRRAVSAGTRGCPAIRIAGGSDHRSASRAVPPTVAARTRMSLRPEFGWITGNLSDLSKGYFATTFLSSSLTCPASQSRFYVPSQFARAFGNDRFQGLERYPSIAALDEIVDHSRSCVPRIGRLA